MLTSIALMVGVFVSSAQVRCSGELDSMNCLATLSHQLSKKTPMTRRISYDLIGVVSILLKIKTELSDFRVAKYDKEPGLAVAQNLHEALLFGSRVRWTETNNSLLQGFGPHHRLVLDILRIVSEPGEMAGLCLIEQVETDYQSCVSILTRSWNAINSNSRVQAPSFSVTEEQIAQAQLLVASDTSLSWLQPDSTETYQFLIKGDHVTEMILHLRELVKHLLSKIVKSLNPFLVYAPVKINNCNYFLFAALLRGKNIMEDEFRSLTNEEKEQIKSQCRLLSQELNLKRSSRSLLSWLFEDHSRDINNLILSQHDSVTADRVLEKNQRTLAGANYILSTNLLKLSQIEQNNSEALLSLIREVSTRESLHFIENALRAEKLSFVSSLRDLNVRLSHLASESALLLQRLVADLSPMANCNLDSEGRGVSCAPDLAFVDSLENGELLLASRAHLYERSESFIINCLFLDASLFGHKKIFVGNRLAFLKSDSFYHHRNVSAPVTCFQNVSSTQHRCSKYIGQYSEGGDIIGPMSRKDFSYILTTNYIYIQAVSGTITVSFKSGTSVPVSGKPFKINKSRFPVFVNGDQFQWEELSGIVEIKPQTNFFLNSVNDDYFHFVLPQLATSLSSDDFSLHWAEMQDSFQQNPIVKAVSITGLVICAVFIATLTLAIYLCCRKRVDQPRLYAEWYNKSKRTSDSVPPRPPKASRAGAGEAPGRSFLSRFRKAKPPAQVIEERSVMLSDN